MEMTCTPGHRYNIAKTLNQDAGNYIWYSEKTSVPDTEGLRAKGIRRLLDFFSQSRPVPES